MKTSSYERLIGLTVESSIARIEAENGKYVLKPLSNGDTNNNSGQGLVFGGKAYKSIGRVVKALAREDGVIELHHAPFACTIGEDIC